MAAVRIWDAATRVSHWLMVLLLGTSWWTAGNQRMDLHRYSGYALLGVLMFRLYWGIFGSATARFRHFVKGPRSIWRYLQAAPAEPGAGHNPLGALSVIALLGLLLCQVALGLFSVDVDGLESGPLSHWVSFAAGRTSARLHHLCFGALKVLVLLHLAAVLFYWIFKRDNLIRPMITGHRAWSGPTPELHFASGRRALLGIALAVLLVWSVATQAAAAQDAKTVISKASHAIGADTLEAVRYSASGFDYAFGQAANPDLPWPRFIERSYTRIIDFNRPASRVDRVRLQGENPPRGGGGQPLVGEQSQTQTTLVSSDTPWAQEVEIWLTPHGFLQAASRKDASAATQTIKGHRYTVVSFDGKNHSKVNGYINDRNEVERVETWIDTPVLGNTPLEVAYSEYRDVNGIRFPTHILQSEGGHPILDLRVTDIVVNPQLSAADFPGAPGNGPAANPSAKAEKLGEGIYLITGGYSVIAIDFADHVTLLESGQSDTRAAAVIAEVKKLLPGKPIEFVVNTHPHFDHSGGLRAVAAEGATILTYKLNTPYLKKVLAQPRTLSVEAAQQGGGPKVEGLDEKTVLTDGTHVVEIYHLQGLPHHDGMLVAYLPKERILFEADAYNPSPLGTPPPSPASPNNLSLLDNIQRLHLDVRRIIPVHYPADNRLITVAEVNQWVGRNGS